MTIDLEFAIDTSIDDFALRMRQRGKLAPVTAIFGQSGAGKTTLLDILAGFRRAEGLVRFGNLVWEDQTTWCPPWRRNVGTVFQHAALFPHLNVDGNLAFAEKRAKSNRGLGRTALIELTGIADLLKRATHNLSGGERRRVAIARSMAARPALLLLDEPMAGLDVSARAQLLPVIRRVALETAVPVIMVSHDIDDIVACADQIWCVDQGQLVESGRLTALYPRLAERLPAAKTGSLLHATLRRATAGPLSELSVGEQVIHVATAELQHAQAAYRVRVLARDVALSRRAVEGISIRNQLTGTVVELAECDDTVTVTLDIEGQSLLASVTADARSELNLRVGSSVWALIKAVALESQMGLEFDGSFASD